MMEVMFELRSILRCFDRDDILVNRSERAMGEGVRVFITYRRAQRIRDLLDEVKENE